MGTGELGAESAEGPVLLCVSPDRKKQATGTLENVSYPSALVRTLVVAWGVWALNFFKKNLLFEIILICVCVCTLLGEGTQGDRKRASALLKLEIQAAGSFPFPAH